MSLHVHPRQSTPCGRNLLCAGLEPGVWFSLLEACSQCNMGHSTCTVRASAFTCCVFTKANRHADAGLATMLKEKNQVEN